MKIGTYTLEAGIPAIMGIINATPDSFSDGGLYLKPANAIEHALRLEDEGADLIDIGGESTRPGADPVSAEDEITRVIPVIEGIRRRSRIPISIDTAKSEVARSAIDAGADMINDVSAGRFDGRILGVAAEVGTPICLMHIKGTPRDMQDAPRYEDLIGEISSYLGDAAERAKEAGVPAGSILVDPGIGFGKSVEDNLEILKRLDRIGELGYPLLIGTSRKSFIGKLLDADLDNRLEGTLATLATSIDRGVSVLRVHDVSAVRKFLKIYLACR